MYILLVLLLTAQQWTTPFRVSPDTLPGTHPAITTDCWGGTWLCWYSSGHLWSRSCQGDIWSEPILVDTTKCIYPEVTTSSMCRDVKGNAVVAWVDASHYVRLSTCMIRKGMWVTSSPDLRIKGENPAITCDGSGNIWCAWTMFDTSGAELCYEVTYYDGKEWAVPTWLARILPVEITYTAGITADHKGNVRVSYNDHESVWAQCWDGNSWSKPERIGTCFDYAYPTMCADSAVVWVAWFNSIANMGDGGIFARYYDGVEWSESIEFPHGILHDQGWHNSHADICIDGGGRMWAGWWETAGIYCPNYAILGSFYEGGVWDRISWVDYSAGTCWGGYPSIACGDEEVWMVWQSEKEGDCNIYSSYCQPTVLNETTPPPAAGSSTIHSYPNPFTISTSITWWLRNDSPTALSIYNIQGELVWTWLCPAQNAGVHTVVWDGTDNSGRKVSAGPYFLRLEASRGQAGRYTGTRKLLVIR